MNCKARELNLSFSLLYFSGSQHVIHSFDETPFEYIVTNFVWFFSCHCVVTVQGWNAFDFVDSLYHDRQNKIVILTREIENYHKDWWMIDKLFRPIWKKVFYHHDFDYGNWFNVSMFNVSYEIGSVR